MITSNVTKNIVYLDLQENIFTLKSKSNIFFFSSLITVEKDHSFRMPKYIFHEWLSGVFLS